MTELRNTPHADATDKADFAQTVVSVYQNTFDTRGITAPLSSVIQRVRNGGFGLKRKTARARTLAAKNKPAYRKFKGRQLTAFTPAGVFSRRNRKGLVSHSGLLVLDYDDIEGRNLADMKEIATDAAHTATAFVSSVGERYQGAGSR